eukprot:CAMPEP_0171346298 /NCGR_PEP_ID=MMETSP0878-20121228/24384_1 /TAXON_ID=67004 /ORGANISM="Thalassiosira weissflogii, Strain CCMP1336" /LENGTH=543 /DNA_ID=CAMNT_0011849957 /DNA_START=114 /DNA_END=1745 /DNA_ORIENTATION=+
MTSNENNKNNGTTASNTTQPPSLFCSIGSPETSLSNETVQQKVNEFLSALGPRRDVLILPPDFTRFHSQAGMITRFVSEYYNFTKPENPTTSTANTAAAAASSSPSPPASVPKLQIIPALGTHAPMTHSQIDLMFGKELASKTNDPDVENPFVVHNWRDDVVTIGYAPATMVSEATYGMVHEPWPAQLNKLVWERRKDNHDASSSDLPPLVLSIGQVVPHEVMGMANFNKNLFVGVGGVEAINLSHFIGAVHGMEKLMGRGQNPLRSILNYASETFLQTNLDLWYILTVMGTNDKTGEVEIKGLYIGRDEECYNLACDLSLKVNFNLLEKSPKKMVVYLNEEYHSTWLGNKSIYRTRMAIDDGGELVVLAPSVEMFGEDGHIDELIRKVGYVGTPKIMEEMGKDEDLKNNLSAVAHLIHGSSEGRFEVTYCPGKLTREEVEGVGFKYGDLEEMKRIYDYESLKDGWNTRITEDGEEEEFYFISNPALGLWAVPSRFVDDASADHHRDNHVIANNEISLPRAKDQKPIDISGGVGGWKLPPNND